LFRTQLPGDFPAAEQVGGDSAGMVHVNDATPQDEASAPFGGIGQSGLGGRSGGDANLEEFTERRLASVLDGPLGASEYIAGDDVVMLSWWGPQPDGVRPDRVRLAGLDADARYRDIGSGHRHWGSALMAAGLELPQESASTFGSTQVRLVWLGRDQRRLAQLVPHCCHVRAGQRPGGGSGRS
jgi:Glycosyl hydrolase family 36 C-terminal domain/Aldehyde dehydrogenase family